MPVTVTELTEREALITTGINTGQQHENGLGVRLQAAELCTGDTLLAS